MTLAIIALLAANFITPEMTYRRGLTDEQYEYLWSIGRHPQIEPAAAKDWMFKSFRYGNTTNWLNIVGQTNDFAKLSYVLQDENFKLEETNSVLVAINDQLVNEVEKWMAKSEAFSNAVVIAQGRLAAASAKINGEIAALKEEKADLEAKIADSKYIILRPWLKTKLAAVEARIKVLEALTVNES